MSLNEKEITSFRNTFTEIVNAQNSKRCIGGIKLCFKVCICYGFYDSYCRFILVIYNNCHNSWDNNNNKFQKTYIGILCIHVVSKSKTILKYVFEL